MTMLIGLAGGALRFLPLFWSRSLWEDEVASIRFAKGSFVDAILLNIRDTHPPLYFTVLHTFIHTLGLNEWVFRLPNMLAGCAMLAGTYLFTRRYFCEKSAQAALLFAGASSYALHSSIEVRNHGFAAAFTALGSYFLVKLIQAPEKKIWGLAYASSAWLAVATTHFAWFWAMGMASVHSLSAIKKYGRT